MKGAGPVPDSFSAGEQKESVPVLERDGAVFATDQPERSEQSHNGCQHPLFCGVINRRINLRADDHVLAKYTYAVGTVTTNARCESLANPPWS